MPKIGVTSQLKSSCCLILTWLESKCCQFSWFKIVKPKVVCLGVGIRRAEQVCWSSISPTRTVRSYRPIEARARCSCSPTDVRTSQDASTDWSTFTSAALRWQRMRLDQREYWVLSLVAVYEYIFSAASCCLPWQGHSSAWKWTVIPHLFWNCSAHAEESCHFDTTLRHFCPHVPGNEEILSTEFCAQYALKLWNACRATRIVA